MIRRVVLLPFSVFVLALALVLSGCSSVAGTSPVDVTPPASSTGPSISSGPIDPAAQRLELHYVRFTIAGRQSEHTAHVRGDGEVRVSDELTGAPTDFTLTGAESARLDELLPVLADAPEPTSGVTDVGRIDARFPVGGREIAVSVDDWSMAGGTARLPADERAVADAMIELRDLLIRPSSGATSASTAATPTS